MSKLWDKGIAVDAAVERFTVGRDIEFDVLLAKSDILGSMAHGAMLASIGLLEPSEFSAIHAELKKILLKVEAGNFVIESGVEDIHSQVELMLTRSLGDVGKKIHSGRSRNDQVLVDLKLYFRDAIERIVEHCKALFSTFQLQSEKNKNVLLPGYTHFQIAMPSSFGLWFGAYAESLSDDMELLLAAYNLANENPLGSGAGYGSSFPLNRRMTTELLGFEDMNYNVVYAQMTRGKTEKSLAFAIASIAATLNKYAMDACLFNSQNFGFIALPDAFTTGSSIMPHKKNPDVFEIMRGKCSILQNVPMAIGSLLNNLPSGYHRETQLLKELIIPAIDDLLMCLEMANLITQQINVKTDIIYDSRYAYLFSVEEVNKLVLKGVPFRDAYKEIGKQIGENNFEPDYTLHHVHEGSIGNLCNDEIDKRFNKRIDKFQFSRKNECTSSLINIKI